jgi:hypothetical protein
LIQIKYADYERQQEIVKSVAAKIRGREQANAAVRIERAWKSSDTNLAPIEAALRHAHQLRKPPFSMVDG